MQMYFTFVTMSGNSFGSLFRITTFGESHGYGIGVVIDGCPAGLSIDESFIQSELDRRRPGQSAITSPRQESDAFQVISGVYKGKSLGSPITILIPNTDAKSTDYAALEHLYRPSHADFTYEMKYGIRDHRGGGRASARETAARVAAGAVAKMLLREAGIQIQAYVSSIGELTLNTSYKDLDLSLTEQSLVRCPDPQMSAKMLALVESVRNEGDSVGGIITGVIRNPGVGIGEPVFDKLHADLGKGMLSIHAVHGFEYGSGFEGTRMKGSMHNDVPTGGFSGHIYQSEHNYSGGVQGGISNGEDIYFRVGFKPVATILSDQKTIDKNGETVHFKAKGRHDPCVLPRAVPIVEAMAALVMADLLLRSKSSRIKQ